MLSPEERRRLRRIERGLLVTDAAWAGRVFGDRPRLLRPGALVVCLGLDATALALIAAGLLFALPLVFAGCLIGNVAVCLHLERGSRRRPAAAPRRLPARKRRPGARTR